MNLYPDDLGEQMSRQVRQERTQRLPESGVSEAPRTFGALAAGSLVLMALTWVLQDLPFAIFFGCSTVFCMLWSGLVALNARNAAECLKKPIIPDELQAIRIRAEDKLIRSYIDLAVTVLGLPPTEDEASDREVRDAITALGTAIEALPPEQKVVTDDPIALRSEAQTQVESAQIESDAVIAASCRRRAESLLRRADTAARTLLLLRRNRALREEVGEQIKALQTSLTALQVGGRQSAPELSGLAASIHRVALEANAVTVARAEVDTLLSRPMASSEIEEPREVRLSL